MRSERECCDDSQIGLPSQYRRQRTILTATASPHMLPSISNTSSGIGS